MKSIAVCAVFGFTCCYTFADTCDCGHANATVDPDSVCFYSLCTQNGAWCRVYLPCKYQSKDVEPAHSGGNDQCLGTRTSYEKWTSYQEVNVTSCTFACTGGSPVEATGCPAWDSGKEAHDYECEKCSDEDPPELEPVW